MASSATEVEGVSRMQLRNQSAQALQVGARRVHGTGQVVGRFGSELLCAELLSIHGVSWGVCRTCDAPIVAWGSRQKPRREIALGNFAMDNRQAEPAATELMSENGRRPVFPMD